MSCGDDWTMKNALTNAVIKAIVKMFEMGGGGGVERGWEKGPPWHVPRGGAHRGTPEGPYHFFICSFFGWVILLYSKNKDFVRVVFCYFLQTCSNYVNESSPNLTWMLQLIACLIGYFLRYRNKRFLLWKWLWFKLVLDWWDIICHTNKNTTRVLRRKDVLYEI